jgi:hypothetical protein
MRVCRVLAVDIECDDAKDAANLAKRGVSLGLGAIVIAGVSGKSWTTGGTMASAG